MSVGNNLYYGEATFRTGFYHEGGDHHYDLGVTSLPLIQRAQVRFPVGSIFWLVEFFPGFSSTITQMWGKFRSHSSPGIIWPSSRSIFIHLWTATVSDLKYNTWQSLNKITPYHTIPRRRPWLQLFSNTKRCRITLLFHQPSRRSSCAMQFLPSPVNVLIDVGSRFD